LKPTHWSQIKKTYNQSKIVSKAYHNQTISKSNQNNKNPRKIDQKPVPGLFLSLFLKPTHWNHIKTVSKSHQNQIKIVSKSYQNHIKTTAKSYQNHQNPREIDQKAAPGLFPFPFLKPTRQEPCKRRSVPKPYQTISKSHPKPYPKHKHNKTISKS
jgi:hypothetical protein